MERRNYQPDLDESYINGNPGAGKAWYPEL